MPGPLTAALRDRLRERRRLCVLSGAGISAESGVPTFRDAADALWSRFRPEELANPAAFARDPGRVWAWYAWRRQHVLAAEPNAAHHALVRLARAWPDTVVVTQNVDGLHQRAGLDAVIEFHGSLLRNRCAGGCGAVDVPDPTDPRMPACPGCGRPVRPDVVWFGETIPADALAAAAKAAARCTALLVVGTSAEVYPAAGLADIARAGGAALVEINPSATPLTDSADISLRGPAGRGLPALVAALLGPEPTGHAGSGQDPASDSAHAAR